MESNTMGKVKERPIPFIGDMVRAVILGKKTQTRRMMNPQPSEDWRPLPGISEIHKMKNGEFILRRGAPIVEGMGFCNAEGDEGYVSKYGIPGDRLWVKEAIKNFEDQIQYTVDGSLLSMSNWPWKIQSLPPMYMPRSASRIDLEILKIRPERLNDISEEDAQAEGIETTFGDASKFDGSRVQVEIKKTWLFKRLWESINGPGSWEKNPWVWVIEFRRIV